MRGDSGYSTGSREGFWAGPTGDDCAGGGGNDGYCGGDRDYGDYGDHERGRGDYDHHGVGGDNVNCNEYDECGGCGGNRRGDYYGGGPHTDDGL